MELAVYYVRGDIRAWLRPDLQVVFGLGRRRERSTFNAWDEGKAPDFVLEVASPSTAEHDAQYKRWSTLQSECANTGDSTRQGR